MNGFAADLTDAQRQSLAADSDVLMLSPDSDIVRADGQKPPPVQPQPPQTIPTGIQRIGGLQSPTAKIDGVDERINADIAILDTGISVTHPDLNLAGGYNCSSGPSDYYQDNDGHGTHVAGIADRKSTRLNSSHSRASRMPSSA